MSRRSSSRSSRLISTRRRRRLRLHRDRALKWYWKWVERFGLTNRPRVRKLIVGVIGGTLVLFGLALVILPGPAVVVIPLGLAVLATEFAWARRLVRRGGVFWDDARRRLGWGKSSPPKGSLGHDPR